MTQDSLEKALYIWAVSVLGTEIPVKWAYQNVQRPSVLGDSKKATPHVLFNLKTDTKIGEDHVSRFYDSIDEYNNPISSINITGNREFALHCQSFGRGSSEFLKSLRKSLSYPSVQIELSENGIVFVSILMPLSNVPELVESRWEDRNVMDLLFRYAETGQDVNVGSIETVNYKLSIKNASQQIDKNKTVTING